MKSVLIVTLLSSGALLGAQAQDQELPAKLAAVRQSVARNQDALRAYSWTSQTEVRRKGEVKKTKEESCRYGPDGTVQKTEIAQSAPPKEKHGTPKKKVDKKVDALKDYIERAITLIHNYVPPSPPMMETSLQDGKVSVGPSGPGTIQLQVTDYFKRGDSLTFQFDSASRSVRKINIKSYLGDPKDVVTLEVDFQSLPDATNYAAVAVLNAPAKAMQVTVRNVNYLKIAGM